jgi:hypothetical protein
MEQQKVFAQMALKAWHTQINETNKFIDSIPDETFFKQVAPGRNRVIYLVGHLIGVNDTMIKLYGLGERLYTHYDDVFVYNPDNKDASMPEPSALREEWKKSNEVLAAHFAKMSPADWFSKHTAMTDEDAVKDPGRNKLSVLINRTNHVANHLGQLLLVSAHRETQ